MSAPSRGRHRSWHAPPAPPSSSHHSSHGSGSRGGRSSNNTSTNTTGTRTSTTTTTGTGTTSTSASSSRGGQSQSQAAGPSQPPQYPPYGATWASTVTTPGYTIYQTHNGPPARVEAFPHPHPPPPGQPYPPYAAQTTHIVHHHPTAPEAQQQYTLPSNPNPTTPTYYSPYYRTAPLPQKPPTYSSLDAYYRHHGLLPPRLRPANPPAPTPPADPHGLTPLYFSGNDDTVQLLHRAGLNGASVDITPWKWVGEPGNGGFRICEVRKKKVEDIVLPQGMESMTRGLAAHLLMGVRGARSQGWGEGDGWFPGPEGPGGRGDIVVSRGMVMSIPVGSARARAGVVPLLTITLTLTLIPEQ
ncbi:hypothetical protein DFH27DRAFT_653585 [Peziza echinospora]|nr:hypothetical protein DFH27DRAFT_653585 [Peziza echinospora]